MNSPWSTRFSCPQKSPCLHPPCAPKFTFSPNLETNPPPVMKSHGTGTTREVWALRGAFVTINPAANRAATMNDEAILHIGIPSSCTEGFRCGSFQAY